MVRSHPFSIKWPFVFPYRGVVSLFVTTIIWLSLQLTPAYAQYSISTNGEWDPQFNSPTDITVEADVLSEALDIGFDFSFFGETYNQFYVSSNGFVTFDPASGSGSIAQDIPDTDIPNALIALAWGDLDPDAFAITYETIGSAPYRSLHVQFTIQQYSNPPTCEFGYYLNAQIVLRETTNIIELHTGTWNGDGCSINATQGLEDQAGMYALTTPGRNLSLWNAQNDFIAFLPDSYLDLEAFGYEPVLCEGIQDIVLRVRNLSGIAIDTFYTDWTWEGVPQDSQAVYTNLPPNAVTDIVLGQKTLESDSIYDLVAWTYNPENNPDIITSNDTLAVAITSGMQGTYTIGGTTPDFATIQEAVTSLITLGACDTVVFNIRPGTYTEELDIPYLAIAPGAKIIFQSETSDPADVTITRNYTSGSNNRMIEINNASHLHFKNLTLKVTGTVCSNVVYLNSYCADIQFTGCDIIGPTCNSTTISGAVVSLVNGQKDDIVLDSNLIKKGSYGVYVAPGSFSFANDMVLTDNAIDSFYRYGAYFTRTQGLSVLRNSIFSVTTPAIGIETNTIYGQALLEQNNIYVPLGTHGIRIYRYNYNTSAYPDTMFVLNNIINLGGAVSGSRAMAVEQSNRVRLWHNTIHTTSTSATSYAFYSTGNTLTDLRNSIITNFGTGRAAWMTALTSDHNDFYSATPPLISNGTNYTLLEDWALASGQDQNSIEQDPDFVSATDLHVGHGALNSAGDTLQPPVTYDIDDEMRNPTSPDIGADEFGFLDDDLMISDLLFSENLLEGENEIKAVVYNIGLNTVNSFTVQWRLNASDLTPVMINTPILAGGGDTILLGTLELTPSLQYNFSVNTHLPNGNADSDMSNDTITLGPVYAKLNGLYTVGGVDPDFSTLSAAFLAISNGGMLDSVSLAVRDGIYEDPIELISQSAYSCDKPVRVYGESGNASEVIFNNDNLVKPTIRLNGVSGISFSNMSFELTASAFHNVVIIENGASCNSFTSCNFTGKISNQTSTAYATVLCNSNQGVDNDFYENLFQLGAYGLVTNGPNISSGSLVDVVGNTFLNNYQQGGSFSNSPQINIIGNYATITSAQHGSYSGMFANNCKRMELSYNAVYNPFVSGGGTLVFSECDGTLQDTTKVFNNFVYAGTSNNLSSIFGGSYSDYTHVSNNTSRSHQGRATGYSWCSNFRIDNNIFQCIGSGVAIELLNMQGTNYKSDNNCLYAPNASIGEFNNTIYGTMAQWQALGFDTASLNENPLFDDLTFHPHAVVLDEQAIPYAHITDDHEGDDRHPTTPDIGADEFDPLAADAGILSILYPKMPFPTGTNPVYVRFYNNSGDTLQSVQFDWEVNGLAQPSFIWNGLLDRGAVYDSLEIGQFDFAAFTPYQVKIWVSQPNGMPDQLTINDTIQVVNQYAGLMGVYTIGGEDPDFETIGSAVNALNAGGASGDVTFNIRNGTYLETILLNDYPGSECNREVIFQSESGDTSLVTITNLGINAYTLVLNGTDGVQFKNLTFKSVNTSFRHVVVFYNGAHCNTFSGNHFKGFQSTATAGTSSVIVETAGLDTANVFINNRIDDGSYSFHLTGNGGGITNTLISGNHLEPYYRGIYNSAHQGVTISHNTIIADNHTSGLGLEIYTGHNLKEFSYNRIQAPGGQYGIYIDNCDNTVSNRGKIYNNFISVGGTGVARGIYLNGSAFQDILHNSVLVYSTNGTLANTTPLYLTSNPSLRVLNNALKNDGSGYAVYANSNTSFASDNNAYYTDGSTFGYWNGGAVETTFASWKTASLQDTNSINIDPNFMSNTDLHTFLVLLDEAGDPTTGIALDFDGEQRDSLPDIGADEFDPLPSNDAGIFMFAGPHIPFASGNHPVNLVVKNFGGNALTSATVRWAVNGIEQTPFEWTGNLPSAICDTFQVGSFVFEELIAYNIDAWTEMPNDTADAEPENDLLSTGTFYASLAGTYTVGGFAPDFNLVSELETILNLAGIVNHVTFEFRPGEYQEALYIKDFPRSSYAYGVTFTSETSDSSDVILTQATNNTALVDMDDAHRITFSHMTLTNTKGHIVQIRNGSSLITLTNNQIESQEALSSSRSLIYSSTTTEDSLSILNNHFHNGYYGIYLYGGDYEKRHIITGNIFTGNYHISLYIRKFDGLTCTNNLFQAQYTGDLDFYLYDGKGACTITHNRINSDLTDIALYIGSITNTSPTSSLFANNFIYKPGTASNDAAVIENVSKINIDFNSIYNDRNHASSAALYTNNLSTHNIRNNIFYSIAGPAYHNNGTLPTVHNYNAIFSLGAVTAIQNSTSYSTFAAYAAGTSTNANSKGVDPLFISEAGPDIAQYQLNSAGLTIAGLTTDINGATRTSPPDIGADEFTPSTFDVKVSHVVTPVYGCGLSDEETVQVALVNMGSMIATGFDLVLNFEEQLIEENIGALQVPPGDTLYYTFSATIDVSAFGIYELDAYITYPADVNHANDTTTHSIENLPPLNSPPGNLIPANGTIGLENQVSLSWSPVTNAVNYDLYVWAQTGSKPVTPTFANLTTINKLVTGLIYGTTYLWQVHAVNACDEEYASDTANFSLRFLPDLLVESITIPLTAFSEQTIGIEWVTRNQGIGSTVPGTWYENIYLSPDPTYNSFDPLLASVSSLNSLNPAQAYAHSANVVIPQGSNGLYYIIVKTDHYNGVKETVDNNNTTYSATQINITLSPPPDLLVTEITTPALTFSGESINMTFTVSNLGPGITTETIWQDEITLIPAPGNNNGITQSYGLRTHIGALLPDSSYTVNLSVAIPENIFGDYQIRINADNRFDVFEFASEGNNSLLSDIIEVVLTPPADLVPDSLNTPDTMSLYGTYPVTFQIKNQGGSAPTVSYTDRYYLSQSPVYNTNFLIHLGYVYHNPGLMPGQYEEKSVNVKLTGAYSGVYYIYLVTDHNNKINEYAFENNNILRSDPIMITRPDLVPDSLIHPAMVMSGSTMSIRTEMINPGPGDLYGSFSNRYYLSEDDSLSTMTDILLSTRSINNVVLTTEDTVSNTFSITLPADQFGAKYLIVFTDATQGVYEANETNNELASPVTIFEAPHPDLTVLSVNAPDTIMAGVNFDVAYTLLNQGDVPVTVNVIDSIFISFSPSWNRSTALPLGTRQTSLIDTSQTISYSLSLETVLNQNPNEYYIYIISDATQKAYEGSGESNNIKRSELVVLEAYPDIDLSLSAFTGLPDTLTSGQTYNVQYEVANLTDFPTYFSAWTDRYYFSVDSIFNAGTDMLLGSLAYSGGSIAQGGTKMISAQWKLPEGITGDYYAFIETDSEDLNEDTDRSNNANTIRNAGQAKRLHVKLALYPDLQPTSFNCPVEVVSGQYFTIKTTVTNQGTGSAKARADKIFVSANNVIENGDYTLASLSKGVLSAQMTQSDSLTVFVPASYSGNYFVIYSVDHGNLVYEHTQESNNIVLTSIVATPPPPADLIVSNVLVPDSVLAGQTASITWNTKNTGTNPASGIFREIVYLSPDTSWNLMDEVIGIWDGSVSLGPGAMTTKTVSLPYNNVTNADYHTIIRTDARNNIPESNEANNDGFSFDLTNVDIEEIFFDTPEETFLSAGVNRYFKLFVGAENASRNILITLAGDSLLGVNQMYVKHEAVPTPADHDYAYSRPFAPHQQVMIRNAEPGYYYIMLNGFMNGNNMPQSVELLARILRMEIIDMSPRKGGDKGYTTIEAIGSELDSIIIVKLVLVDTTQEYHEILADTFFMADDGARVVARFNLENEILGYYDFMCERESIWMASVERGFEIVAGRGADIQVNYDFNPKSYNPRFNTLFQMKIDVENIGDSDAEDRFIRVNTPQFDNPVYYSLSDYYNHIQHTQLILASEDLDGFPGVLRPGSRRTFYVFGQIGGTQGFSIFYDK